MRAVAGVNDQFFLGEKPERALPYQINGVSKVAVICFKHGHDRAALMVVGCIIDLLTDYEFRYRKLRLESSTPVSPPNG